MLSPKRQKFRKMQKGRMKGNSQRGHRLSNGMFGIKSLESKFITSRQIEAARDRKSTRLELQSHSDLVCRLLLEKKKINIPSTYLLIYTSEP